MSSALYWKPPTPPGDALDDGLKFVLRSYWGQSFAEGDLSSEDAPFLKGVAAGTSDMGLKSCIAEVLRLIEKYGHITLWEEN